jgi:hypothetical protein
MSSHSSPSLRSGRSRHADARALALALAAVSLGTVACSDSDSSTITEQLDNQPSEPAGGQGTDPLYLVAPAFFNADDVETYLLTVSSFDADTSFNPTSGAKVLGEVVPIVYDGAVYVTDARAPVIARFDVGADNQLVKGDEVSFAGAGITELTSWYVYIVSDTKGYLYDPAGLRIVVWDPSTMTLTGKQIDLSPLARDGWTPRLSLEVFSPWRRGAELIVPVAWTGQDGEYRFANGLLVLDVERDEVVTTAEDARCGESYMSWPAANGDRYLFPSHFSSSQHFFADQRGPTCVLRVLEGESSFDPSFQLNLSALGSGGAAIGGVPDGEEGFFFATADEALWNERANNGGAYWKLAHYDFASEVARPVESMPTWSGSPYYVDVGGKFYLPYWRQANGVSLTTVYDLNGAQDPTPLFTFEASWTGFGQLR